MDSFSCVHYDFMIGNGHFNISFHKKSETKQGTQVCTCLAFLAFRAFRFFGSRIRGSPVSVMSGEDGDLSSDWFSDADTWFPRPAQLLGKVPVPGQHQDHI